MRAQLWSDYLCPWCYLGRDRSSLLEHLGVEVTTLAYELHPEIGPSGLRPRPDGRQRAVYARIEEECETIGLAIRPPARIPSTRRALGTAEVVRAEHPGAFASLDQALFRAHFVEGAPLDDPDLLDELVAEAGAPSAQVRAAVEDGTGATLVAASMDQARSVGVASTPTWLVDGHFLIPGVQPRDTVRRWVSRLLAKRQEPAS